MRTKDTESQFESQVKIIPLLVDCWRSLEIVFEQVSPPAWMQEAYRLPHSKYYLCCPIPSWWGGGGSLSMARGRYYIPGQQGLQYLPGKGPGSSHLGTPTSGQTYSTFPSYYICGTGSKYKIFKRGNRMTCRALFPDNFFEGTKVFLFFLRLIYPQI